MIFTSTLEAGFSNVRVFIGTIQYLATPFRITFHFFRPAALNFSLFAYLFRFTVRNLGRGIILIIQVPVHSSRRRSTLTSYAAAPSK